MKKLFFILTLAIMLLTTPAMAGEVTLGWDANTETDLAGYRVYYGGAPGQYIQVKGSGIDVPLSADEDPAPGAVQYTVKNIPATPTYFVVTAYDTEGLESGYSNEVFTNFGPAKPGGMKIKVIVEVNIN